jgi:hypothetical protein
MLHAYPTVHWMRTHWSSFAHPLNYFARIVVIRLHLQQLTLFGELAVAGVAYVFGRRFLYPYTVSYRVCERVLLTCTTLAAYGWAGARPLFVPSFGIPSLCMHLFGCENMHLRTEAEYSAGCESRRAVRVSFPRGRVSDCQGERAGFERSAHAAQAYTGEVCHE